MSTFYLIRHGQKSADLPDPDLTKLGHQQARATGLYLTGYPISTVIASPMKRTQQTAKHISEALKAEILTDPRLRERMDFDQAKGVEIDDFFREWLIATYERKYIPKWGDSSYDTGKRIENVIQDYSSEENEHVVLITHGGAISDFLRNAFSDDHLKDQLHDFKVGRDYLFHECSVTTIKNQGNKFELAQLHGVSHLPNNTP